MKIHRFVCLLCCVAFPVPAWATLDGDDVTGQLSNPFTAQIYENSAATVGAGDEFIGYQSVSVMGNILQHYADIDDATITIGVRHIGTTGFIFSGSALTYEYGDLDWLGPGEIQDVVLEAVFPQELWPSASDPNAKWVGWGQDAEVPPLWEPVWDPVEQTVTVVATNGFTIPPGYDVWARFRLVVPEPASVVLAVGGVLAVLAARRRMQKAKK